MSRIEADYIITPLGDAERTTDAILSGSSAVREQHLPWMLAAPLCASRFSDADWQRLIIPGLSAFESLTARCVAGVIAQMGAGWHDSIDGCRTLFILSTTKGDIARRLTYSQQRVMEAVALCCEHIVVSNACISGVSALSVAARLTDCGIFDHVIVCGADVVSHFIASGFQSLHALSTTPCRPFDMERCGMNLGEAAAAVIVGRGTEGWHITSSVVRNDAFHISTPQMQGEGAYRALRAVLADCHRPPRIVSAHGTATLFNDQMEAVALRRASTGHSRVSSLKGCIGHTLGAAGVLETILTMHCIDRGEMPATMGFEESGVSVPIDVIACRERCEDREFLKLISGFGGANGVLYMSKDRESTVTSLPPVRVTHSIEIEPHRLVIDGSEEPLPQTEGSLLTALYRERVGGYPRFHKMDGMSQLGWLAAELLIRAEGREPKGGERGVIICTHLATEATDRQYQATITEKEYYPSPSLFVYTLPNIVTGEIAIRHKYHGESACYVLGEENEQMIHLLMRTALTDSGMGSVIGGWADYADHHHFRLRMVIMEKEQREQAI